MVIINCHKESKPLTAHQMTIRTKLKRWYGNTRQDTLLSKVSQLKHELKVLSESLRHRTKVSERNSINKNFTSNQRKIFRKWKEKEIETDGEPTKEEVETFWSNIWAKPKNYNKDAPWLKTLERTYGNDATSGHYEINLEIFKSVINNMKNDRAPGNDMIHCYWIKKLTSTHKSIVNEFKKIYENGSMLPEWLVTSRTILLPKNNQTKSAKNYRPIACQNILYKIFTGIINSFLVDHCTNNEIITLEQAGGKPGSWGCTDQLLINKMILEEVKKNRRNLHMMWFDYKKAFDSVPHDWIIKALELVKVPQEIIRTVKNLMQLWSTKLHLNDVTTDTIKYLSGILQGDCLSLILFVLSVNPLSFLLKLLPGYQAGPPGQRDTKINHLFFVDDLKTYAQDEMGAKLQLELVSKFTKDIGMEFGKDKCAHVYVHKGKRKSIGEKFSIKEMEIDELEEGDRYKYLGQDECIGYDDMINKDRVIKEYFRRVRKIWNSELYANNKSNAHNTFAIPVVTPTFGILNWTKEELSAIDIKTRKILSSTGSFHVNSDVDRLYSPRTNGGRGLNSLTDIYISRTVSISWHLKERSPHNPFLALVTKHEDTLMRVASQLIQCFDVNTNDHENPKSVTKRLTEKIKQNHVHAWIEKPQHGYLMRTRVKVENCDATLTNAWMKKSTFSSHVEGYLCAVQEEEIFTNALKTKRLKDHETKAYCRLCKRNKETIQHIIAACPRLSISMYLPWRHNKVANIIYQSIHPKTDQNTRQRITEVYTDEKTEIWWDTRIKTLVKLEHDKPDIVLWKRDEQKCFIIDICVCLDVNIDKNIELKQNYYLPLAAELKRLYPEYTYEVLPVIIGATGLVTKQIVDNLKKLKVDNIEETILKCQKNALTGTMKIIKCFMKM